MKERIRKYLGLGHQVPLVNYDMSQKISRKALEKLEELGYGPSNSEFWDQCHGFGTYSPTIQTLFGRVTSDHYRVFLHFIDPPAAPELRQVEFLVEIEPGNQQKCRFELIRHDPARLL